MSEALFLEREPSLRASLPLRRARGMIRFVQTPKQILNDARRAGIDLDLIDTNLALPVAERWRQHDHALEFALALEAAGKVHDAEVPRASRTVE